MKKIGKKLYYLSSVLTALLGTGLIFISGLFSSKTQIEKISEYATNVVINHTKSQKLCAVTVEKGSNSGAITDPINEFHNLYGTFKQEKITFASAINADKRHSIFIEDESHNLSLLYCGGIGSIEYHDHYKHFVFPIETMFSDADVSQTADYIAIISESQAKTLLEKANIPKQDDGSFSKEDYKSLIKQPLNIQVDGVFSTFGISNIYYETNYYFGGLKEVMGDFIMVSYYLPNNLRSEQQNMYFLSDYTYQNKYFMDYINSVYPSKDYILKVNHYNVFGEIDDYYLTSFYYSSAIKKLDWLSTLFVVFAISSLFASLVFLFFGTETIFKRKAFCLFVVLLIPYLLFLTLYKITSNVGFFSSFSCKINVYSILIYSITLILLLTYKNHLRFKSLSNKKGPFYEIHL